MTSKLVRQLPRVAVAAAAAVIALVSTGGVAWADSPPPAKVLSRYETHFHVSLARDCGYSRVLRSGRALWVFCDTPTPFGFIEGSTAAEGPFTLGDVPTTLTEVPRTGTPLHPPGTARPEQFLPNPGHLTRKDGHACAPVPGHVFPAAWTSGVAREPGNTAKLVITYSEVCVDNGALLVEGTGILEYDSATNRIVSGPTELFRSAGAAPLDDRLRLGSPIFSGGFLNLFASTCDVKTPVSCTRGRIFAVRVPANPRAWQHGANYAWWFSTAAPGYVRDFRRARTVIGTAAPLVVTADSYSGRGLAIIEQTSIGGSFRVWKSLKGGFGGGSWSPGASAPSLPGCSKGKDLNLCRALIGHPEISKSTEILTSYFDPDPAVNHVRIVRVGW
jgi:hypothetical protein